MIWLLMLLLPAQAGAVMIYTPGEAPQYVLPTGVGYEIVDPARGVTSVQEGPGQMYIFRPDAPPTTIYDLGDFNIPVVPVIGVEGADGQ